MRPTTALLSPYTVATLAAATAALVLREIGAGSALPLMTLATLVFLNTSTVANSEPTPREIALWLMVSLAVAIAQRIAYQTALPPNIAAPFAATLLAEYLQREKRLQWPITIAIAVIPTLIAPATGPITLLGTLIQRQALRSRISKYWCLAAGALIAAPASISAPTVLLPIIGLTALLQAVPRPSTDSEAPRGAGQALALLVFIAIA